MKLDWLEHLKGVASERRTYAEQGLPSRLTDFSETNEPRQQIRTQRLWKWDLHLGYRQNLSSDASDDAIEAERMKAARIFAKMLYGPVIDELEEIRLAMMKSRVDFNDPILQRIEDMISALKVNQP